jgi:hypothetical protein
VDAESLHLDVDRIWIRARISIKVISWIRIRINAKSWIRISIEVMRIRNLQGLLFFLTMLTFMLGNFTFTGSAGALC